MNNNLTKNKGLYNIEKALSYLMFFQIISTGHFSESVRLIVRYHNNIRNKLSLPKVHIFPLTLKSDLVMKHRPAFNN